MCTSVQTSEVYRKLRFTLRYLLGNLHDFDPAHHTVPHALLPLTDRFMLHRLAELLRSTEAHYQSYQFSRAFQARNPSFVAGPKIDPVLIF